MSDGPERTVAALTRLVEEVIERADPPPFEEVTALARRHRRSRLVAGAVAAAVLLAGSVALVVAVDDPAPRPAPASPAGPDGLPAEVADLVTSAMSHPFEMAGGLDGSVAVVWRNLIHPEPTFALVVRDAGGAVSGRLLDQPFDLTAVPGGWVASREGLSAFLVTPDAAVTELPIEPTRVTPEADDVVVPTTSRLLLWRSGLGRLVLPDLAPGADAALVTDHGVLVTASPDGLTSTADGTVVARHELPAGRVVLAGQDDDVTAVVLGEAPDGSVPVEWVLTTHDAGSSWLPQTGSDLGVDEIDSVVVTDSAETLMTTLEGELVVIRHDGTVLRPHPDRIRALTLAGDRLYALDEANSHGPLWWSDDDGRTWARDTLPGLPD